MNNKKLLNSGTYAFALILALFTFGCAEDDITEIEGVCPVVVSTNPEDGDFNVPLNQVVSVTFNEEMDPASIHTTSFIVSGENALEGAITYEGMTASFTPAVNLSPFTVYEGLLTTDIEDEMGNHLLQDFTWFFTTVPELSLSMEPAGAGTLNGAGTFDQNSMVTVTASPNTGYFFMNWTLDGEIVSSNSTYEFEMMGNKDLIANFETIAAGNFAVSLSTTPSEGGTTTGAGQYSSGSTVTVTAVANTGYSFDAWTENNVLVSNNRDYQFVISENRNLIANFTDLNAQDPQGIDLRSAGDFVVLSGAGITNTGVSTQLLGDVGSFPTATITGLDATNVNGTLYTTADPIVEQAKIDLTEAVNDGQSRATNAISLPGQLGGLTLEPGLYVNSSTTGISGTGPQGILTLNGGANDVWIFKMGSTLITDPGTSIVLSGGAQAKNIYWIVGSSATLGTTSVFYGNILAEISITMNTDAELNGRALTRTGSVELDSNKVTKP